KQLKGLVGSVVSLAVSSDGATLYSNTDDNMLAAWDLKAAQITESVVGQHGGYVRARAVSHDGSMIAVSVEGDNLVRLYNVDGKDPMILKGHEGGIYALAFSPDGKTLATGSSDNSIILWDTSNGHQLGTFTDHTDTVRALVFSPDGKILASAS